MILHPSSQLKVQLKKNFHYDHSGNRFVHRYWSRTRNQVDQLIQDHKQGGAATNQEK
jgi:hypothetical protein